MFDFSVVVLSILGTVFSQFGWASGFRLLRVVRPLRLVAKMREIQVCLRVGGCVGAWVGEAGIWGGAVVFATCVRICVWEGAMLPDFSLFV